MRIYLLLLLFPLKLFAQDVSFDKFIDSLVGPFNDTTLPGTLVMVAADGKPKFKKAYGMASLELNVPMTTNHAFAIGSVSKQFTAIAIMQLAAAGKLKLSDDIRKYVPELGVWGRTITIENMLTHSSGISSTERDGWAEFLYDNGVAVHPTGFLKYVTSEKLLFEPGEDYSYNNVAYVINSILIERVSGEKFADYMKNHVFKPAGMINTYVASDLHPLKNLANSYAKGFEGQWRNENVRRNIWQWANGGGNVISTLDDLLQWDIALRESKLLSDEWLKKAWTPYVLKNGMRVNYGYGFEISNFKGLQIIAHNGSIYSYNCYSVQIPEKNLYVFYGTCYPAEVSYIPKKIISRLLSIPAPEYIRDPEQNLLDYVGTYDLRHNGGRITTQISTKPLYLKITSSGDSLFGQSSFRAKTFLKPAGKDRFIVGRPEDQLIVFSRNANDRIDAIHFEPFLFGNPTASEKNLKIKAPSNLPLKFIRVSPDLLKSYAGTYYRPAKDLYLFVESDGERLFAYELNPASKFELLPISDDTFINKAIPDVKVTFRKDKQNQWNASVLGNRDINYTKIMN